MSQLRRLLIANQTRAYEGYPLVISRSVALRYLKQYQMYGNSEQGILPEGYTQLDYIESTGTQYINTGFTPDSNTRVLCKYLQLSLDASNLFGARNATIQRVFTYSVSSDGLRRIGWDNATTPYDAEDNNWHIVDFDGKNKEVKVDNQTLTTLATASFTTPTTMYLFAIHATSGSYVYYSESKIGYCKIWDNDTLVHEFIPAKRNSDNTVGMFDTVSQTFFTNSGTGSFTAGPVLPTPSNPIDVVSVGDKTVNLFDKNNLPERIIAYFANSGTTWSYAPQGYSLRFPCLPNTTYTARYNGNSTQAVLSFASTSDDNIPTSSQTTVTVTQAIRQNSPTTSTPITLTTGASDKWLIVQYNAANPQNTDMRDNLQIEQGSTATSYVPYGYQIPVVATGTSGSPITTPIYLNAPLRKVGGYADVLDYKKGQIIRNVGVKVLDGTEAWASALYPQTNAYRISWTGATAELGTIRYSGVRCTHFEDGGSASTTAPNKIFFANDLNINFPMISDFDTRDKCVQWLAAQYAAGTPVIVYYPLATPVTESIVAPALQTMAGSTTYTTDTEVKPSNMKGVF